MVPPGPFSTRAPLHHRSRPCFSGPPLAGLHKAQEKGHLAADTSLTASHQPQKMMEMNPTSLSRLFIYALVKQK